LYGGESGEPAGPPLPASTKHQIKHLGFPHQDGLLDRRVVRIADIFDRQAPRDGVVEQLQAAIGVVVVAPNA